MPDSGLEETLDAAGYAKVIVALRPAQAASLTTGATAMVAASIANVRDSLQNHFIIPSESQFASLAMAAKRATGRRAAAGGAAPAPRMRMFPHLGLALGFADKSGVAALESDALVSKVVKAPELSLIRPVAARAAKQTNETTWGIQRLRAERLWAAGFTGKGVVVGHLDTGLDGTHPALNGAIKNFAEFDMMGDRVPNAKPHDSGEHGTHTAGTIAGRAGQMGAFGVAPDAQVASAMVIEGGQVIDRILAGMDWIISEGVRIMSMSLGLRGFTPAFQAVVDALRANNVLPVIAVGNEFANTSRSPGNYANVLSVGASDRNDRVADFSGSQKFNRPDDALVPDIVAPGVAVLSCVPGGFAEMDGSSMATPHVAGLAALLLQAKPDASAQELEDAILQSCSRPASMPEARANRGVPDAVKAFAALTGATLPAALAAAPPARGRGRAAKAPRRPRQPMPVAGKARAAGKGRSTGKARPAGKSRAAGKAAGSTRAASKRTGAKRGAKRGGKGSGRK